MRYNSLGDMAQDIDYLEEENPDLYLNRLGRLTEKLVENDAYQPEFSEEETEGLHTLWDELRSADSVHGWLEERGVLA